jgi:hypothetical protein
MMVVEVGGDDDVDEARQEMVRGVVVVRGRERR